MATTLTEENKEYIPKKMEPVPCPICGEEKFSEHEIFGNKGQYRYVECNKCENVYLNPRPSYDEEYLDTAYDQYGMTNDIVINEGNIGAKERDTLDRYQITLRYLESKFQKKGKILDLGCGTGEFVLAAKELGWNAHGIDISKPMTDHVAKNLDVPTKAGQFHELDLSDWGEFDVIFCSHVIEHVPFPNEWMKTFKKHLKEDGILCLNVPNQFAPEKNVQRFLKKIKIRKENWDIWRTPDHLFEPHLKSLRYLVENNGFEILEMFTYSSRETSNESIFSDVFHKQLKWGSKIRLFAKPSK